MKIRALIKEVDKKAYMKEIENDLYVMQEIVGGYIETVPVGDNTLMICNEEGKNQNLKCNFALCYSGNRDNGFDYIHGNAFFVGYEGEEFISIEEGVANEITKSLNKED